MWRYHLAEPTEDGGTKCPFRTGVKLEAAKDEEAKNFKVTNFRAGDPIPLTIGWARESITKKGEDFFMSHVLPDNFPLAVPPPAKVKKERQKLYEKMMIAYGEKHGNFTVPICVVPGLR